MEVVFYPIFGCIDSMACNFDVLANTDDGSCLIISGCTDALALNYNSLACIDDGSCAYSTSCTVPTPTGIHAVDTIHTRVRIKWDNMSSSSCTPNQYRIQYRVQKELQHGVTKMYSTPQTVVHLIKQVSCLRT